MADKKAKKVSGSKKRTLLESTSSNNIQSQGSNQSITLNGSDNEKFQFNQTSSSHESADRTPGSECKKACLSDVRRTSTSASETTPSTTNNPVLSSLSSTSSESANLSSSAIESIQSKITFFNLSTSSSVEKNALQADTDQQQASEHKVNEEIRGIIK